MRIVNLTTSGAMDWIVWTGRPDETIWTSDMILFTDDDGRGERMRWLRSFPPPGDQFWITGRGLAFSYKHNPAQDLWNPGDLNDQYVVIDGGLFFITGVETFRPLISPTQPYGDRSVGILVRQVQQLPDRYHEHTAARTISA